MPSTTWTVGQRCTVRVPATSANLGPGFDSLGLALGLYDVVEAEILAEGLEVEVTGEGAADVPLDDGHLVVRAVLAAASAWGLPPPPGLRLRTHNAIPHGRGLGSSAGAVIAGVRVADLLSPPDLSPPGRQRDLLAVANALEGHPDNAAAALLGGLTVAWCDETDDGSPCPVHAVRISPHPSIEPVVLVPEKRLDTRIARAVLPSLVPHADAARTAGRAALLVHAMTADPSLLLPATQDWLHQEPRAAAMPETLALVGELRAQGHPAVVSGAGPSVLVLCVGDEQGGPGAQAEAVAGSAPPGWTPMVTGIAHQGTRGGVRP